MYNTRRSPIYATGGRAGHGPPRRGEGPYPVPRPDCQITVWKTTVASLLISVMVSGYRHGKREAGLADLAGLRLECFCQPCFQFLKHLVRGQIIRCHLTAALQEVAALLALS